MPHKRKPAFFDLNLFPDLRDDKYLSIPNLGLYPREKPRHTESYAEHKVYNLLKDKLPESWYAWHSLSIHKEDTGEHGETDFVIAIPNRPAILLMEVGDRILIF